MSQDFSTYLQGCKERIDQRLPALLGSPRSEYADAQVHLQRIFDACLYSLTNGGKRVRAALVYATAQALDQADTDDLDNIAGAVEMLHAYSLVHDDLPAMDNDVLRRGKPTCHIAFDEATAILVGDALQSRAFELLATLPEKSPHITPYTTLTIIKELAAAAGFKGMVGGQAIDLASVDKQLDLAKLQCMHQLKTGALIRAAIAMAARWSNASDSQRQALDEYGKAIGLAFQVQDDILDIASNTETLGKTQGADLVLNKPTYPSLLGLEGARELAETLHQQALVALAGFGPQADALRGLANYIIARQH